MKRMCAIGRWRSALFFLILAASGSLCAQDSFVDFSLAGTVPSDARFGILAMRANEECPACLQGTVDVALLFILYIDGADSVKVNRVPDPIFEKGLQGCDLNPEALAELTIEPAASGPGHQLHFSGAAPLQLNCQEPARFPVTPGSNYQAFFRARVSRSSVGKGYFTMIFVSCGDVTDPCPVRRDSVPFQSTIHGIALSQDGFTVQAVAGGGAPPPAQLSILNGEATPLKFAATTSTVTGGPWLSVSPSSGVADPNLVPPNLSITANPAGLAAGTYYGQVHVDAPDAPNTLQLATVVLNVAPATATTAPVLQPTGLVFVSPQGNTDPPAQAITITELQSGGEPFTTDSVFSGSANSWFTFAPAIGSVQANQPVTIQVQPHVTGLAAGIYRGTLSITFPKESVTGQVDLLLVISPTGADTNRIAEQQATPPSCTPSQLLPVFTLLGSNFTVSAAWPSAIEVKVVDDCGNPLTSGSVTTSFSNGDPPLALVPLGDGSWTATWAPRNAVTPTLQVTANAVSKDLTLQGTATLGGQVSDNPGVPVVNAGGMVNAGSFASSASPSPGELVSIFGVNLSDKNFSAPSLPLPFQMDNVFVVLAGRQLPLLTLSNQQINAVVPFETPLGTAQIIVSKNNQLSLPQSVEIRPAEPAAFTVDLSGRGQALVFVVGPDGSQNLADANHPAKAGDAIVIYCSGLGSVNPTAEAGAATPFSLYQTNIQAVVTIGGQPANVFFSGLTPGATGLYQINAHVPNGITPGDSVPVVLSVGGFGGPSVTMAIASK